MKDTIITGKRKKTEIVTYLICFLIAFLLNVYAIIKYDTSFKELFFSLGYVFVASVVIYGAWIIIRLVIFGIKSLFKKK